MMKISGAALVAGLVLLVFGCGGRTKDQASIEIRDGVEIVHNSSAPLHPGRRVDFVEELSLEPGKDSDAIKLFMPRAYAVDERGFLYVSDDKDPGVKVFRPDGRPVRVIGSKGNGPGQFQAIRCLDFLPDGRLLVLDPDLIRISLFDPEGRFLSSHQFGSMQLFFEIYLAADSFFVRDVLTLERLQDWRTYRQHLRIAAFDYSGKEVASFGDFEARQSGFVPGKFSFSLPYPVCSVFAGDRLNRRLYHCLNDQYRIQAFNENGTVIREFDRPYTRLGVTEEDWKAYLADFEVSKENRTALEKNTKRPVLKPVTPYMIVDDAGRLWVQLHERSAAGEHALTAFDIFDDKGRYESQVASPVVPGLFRNGKMYRLETDPETGERTLKRYRVIWSG